MAKNYNLTVEQLEEKNVKFANIAAFLQAKADVLSAGNFKNLVVRRKGLIEEKKTEVEALLV